MFSSVRKILIWGISHWTNFRTSAKLHIHSEASHRIASDRSLNGPAGHGARLAEVPNTTTNLGLGPCGSARQLIAYSCSQPCNTFILKRKLYRRILFLLFLIEGVLSDCATYLCEVSTSITIWRNSFFLVKIYYVFKLMGVRSRVHLCDSSRTQILHIEFIFAILVRRI